MLKLMLRPMLPSPARHHAGQCEGRPAAQGRGQGHGGEGARPLRPAALEGCPFWGLGRGKRTNSTPKAWRRCCSCSMAVALSTAPAQRAATRPQPPPGPQQLLLLETPCARWRRGAAAAATAAAAVAARPTPQPPGGRDGWGDVGAGMLQLSGRASLARSCTRAGSSTACGLSRIPAACGHSSSHRRLSPAAAASASRPLLHAARAQRLLSVLTRTLRIVPL